MKSFAPLLVLLLCLPAAISCATEPSPTERKPATSMITLQPERQPAEGEALWLEVTVGVLPAEATLVIEDQDGKQIGGIAPYGKGQREAGGGHLLPLPPELQKGQTLKLRARLHLKDQVLEPSPAELREIKLVYVPISR